MGMSIQQLIDELPADRKAKVEADASRLAAEMIAEADTLEGMRKAVGKTQVEVGKQLGIKQNAVSQLESRTEMYVSRLRKYVEALGMHLQIAIVTKDGERIEVPNFHPWDDSAGKATLSRVASVSPTVADTMVKKAAPKTRKRVGA